MKLAMVPDRSRATLAVGDESNDDDPPADADDATDDDATPDEASTSPWRRVLTVEDTPTGDGRFYEAGSFTWREPPIPFMATDTTAFGHDGAVMVGHIVAVERVGNDVVGTIEPIDPNGNERVAYLQGLIANDDLPGTSVDMDNLEGELIIRYSEDEQEMLDGDEDVPSEMRMPIGGDTEQARFTAARIIGATALPFPAFAETMNRRPSLAASLAAGRMDAIVAAADSTTVVVVAVPSEPDALAVDGGLPPEELHVTIGFYGEVSALDADTLAALTSWVEGSAGWSTAATSNGIARMGDDDPQAVVALVESPDLQSARDSLVEVAQPDMRHPHYVPHMTLGYGIDMPAESIGAVDLSGIELWVGPDKITAADATGGEQDEPDGDDAPEADDDEAALVAAVVAPDEPPSAWFADPKLTAATGLTVTDDGRVYGHLALWDECHIGFQNECVLAPRSRTNYAAYQSGPGIVTAEGDRVKVGQITVAAGHADIRDVAATARRHYDHTGWAAADVCCGEDEHGIWLAGAVRSNLDAAALREFLAAEVSGDWRRIDGNLELVAVASVNTPGFPRLRSRVASGHVEAMVAAATTCERPHTEPNSVAARIAQSIGRHPRQLQEQRDALAARIGRDPATRRAALLARVKGDG